MKKHTVTQDASLVEIGMQSDSNTIRNIINKETKKMKVRAYEYEL